MNFLTFFIATFCSISTLVRAENPICIIGAGPSGINAAYQLEQLGYENVVLFEKSTKIGGKTVPYQDDSALPFGYLRHVYFPGMYEIDALVDLLGESGLSPVPKLNLPPPSLFNATSPSFPIQEIPAELVGAAVQKYMAITTDAEFYAMVHSGYHRSDTPSELLVPFRTWLYVNDLTILEPLLYNGVTNFGYGYFEEVPAIYQLKYFEPQMFLSVVQRNYKLMPFHLLLQQYAGLLRTTDIRLSTEVTKAKFVQHKLKDNKWILNFQDGSGSKEVDCAHLFFAAPPVEKAVEIIKKSLSDARRGLLQQLYRSNYHEFVIANIPDAMVKPGGTLARSYEPISTDGPSIYIKYLPQGKTLIFMVTRESASFADALSLIQDQLSLFFGHEIQESDVAFYSDWAYFPRVSTESMLAGFFEDFEDLQGDQNLWFFGGVADFELVNNCLKSSKRLVGIFDERMKQQKEETNVGIIILAVLISLCALALIFFICKKKNSKLFKGEVEAPIKSASVEKDGVEGASPTEVQLQMS